MFSFHGKRPLDEEDRALSSPFEKKRRAEPHGEAEQEEHTENESYQEEEPGETDDLGEGEAFAQEEAPGEGEDGEEKQEEPLEQDERAYDEGPVSKSFHALEAEMKDFVHSILPCGEQFQQETTHFFAMMNHLSELKMGVALQKARCVEEKRRRNTDKFHEVQIEVQSIFSQRLQELSQQTGFSGL